MCVLLIFASTSPHINLLPPSRRQSRRFAATTIISVKESNESNINSQTKTKRFCHYFLQDMASTISPCLYSQSSSSFRAQLFLLSSPKPLRSKVPLFSPPAKYLRREEETKIALSSKASGGALFRCIRFHRKELEQNRQKKL